MSKADVRIFIVDDDAKFRRSLARLINSIGYDVELFSSAKDFLGQEPYAGTSCLLLDVRMPGLNGPDLQAELNKKNISIPIIFLTAHGDTPTGVKAMKDGAVDFLLKPIEEHALFEAIDNALDRDAQSKKHRKEIEEAKRLVATLTPREHETFRWLITGMLNKQIAGFLGITERTVKAHRGQIMRKFEVVSVAELVRLAQKADVSPARESPRL
ncbi:MAG: response regulator transcription factor [Planctomycetota bacterium]|jgi:FixJ family two-component response regulator